MCELEKALTMKPTRVFYNGVLVREDGVSIEVKK